MRPFFCNIDTVNSVTLLKNIENVSGIKFSTYYICGAFTFSRFLLRTRIFKLLNRDFGIFEKYVRYSISYIFFESSEVSYVIPASFKKRFESFVATDLLDLNTWTTATEVLWQLIATKNIWFDPNLMTKTPFQVKGTRSYNVAFSSSFLGP